MSRKTMELTVTDDITAEIAVQYQLLAGSRQTRETPGEPPDVEIQAVRVNWLQVYCGIDLEIQRKSLSETQRESIDAWVWNSCLHDLKNEILRGLDQ